MDTTESLFSLEVHIESIDRLKVSCVIPAVSFRLLDFPSLIIHLISPANVQKLREKSQVQGFNKDMIETEFKDRYGSISFTKGKSCLFSANVVNLQSQLQLTPLYLMLLDVWHKKPKLVGSTMIPLKNTIDKIAADVEQLGVSVPSISQQEGTFEVYNLMGTAIGSVRLCLRILSLGGSVTPHIPPQSIMTRAPARPPEQKEPKVEDNVILEDLEVIDDELDSKESVTPTLHSAATQTNVPVPKGRKRVVRTSPPYMEDTGSEPAVIANTVCPPPLYYHFRSHKENSDKKIEKSKVKETSYSRNTEDVDFVYYKPDLVQPDGSCGCASVCVQTDDRRNFPAPKAEEKHRDNSDNLETKLDSDDLPLLTALLEELSFLRNKRKGDTKVATPRKVLSDVTQPQQREPRLRECCSKVIAEKTAEVKKQKSKTTVLTQKRVKFKQTNLKYGMTKTQLMRLEMNQKGRQLPSNSKLTSSKEHERKVPPSQRLPNQERNSSESNVRRDFGRTQTFPVADRADEQTHEAAAVQNIEDPAAIMENKDSNDTMRTDSVNSSSRALSSPTSIDIFLPQMEGDSDVGSDIFDTTALDAEDRFAPYATYKKYGHTGIPDKPEQSRKSTELTDTLKEIIAQSELGEKSLNQSELVGNGLNQQDSVEKRLHQSDSDKHSDQSESTKTSPVLPLSPRKSPELTRRRSVTSQPAKSRTSTALSMYSDDFEECPVWDSPKTTDNESSTSSSISHSSYHSLDSQSTKDKRRDHTEPLKSDYSPLKSKDMDKHNSSKDSASDEGSVTQQQSLDTLDDLEQFQDSLNSPSKEISDSEKDTENRSVLHLPKPGNNMGYTF